MILLLKTKFCLSTIELFLLGSAKKTVSVTLNVMISQLVRLFVLKFGVHVHNKLGSRSYAYIHSKNFHICIIHLVLERCYFEVVLSKR